MSHMIERCVMQSMALGIGGLRSVHSPGDMLHLCAGCEKVMQIAERVRAANFHSQHVKPCAVRADHSLHTM